MGMMLCAPAGNDILFDDALCEQGRNFNNKIWNAFRLVKGWNVDATIAQPEAARLGCEWFDAMLTKTALEVDDLMSKYRLSEALMAVYRLFWDEFSSWYLEIVKPAYGCAIDKQTYDATLHYFDALLRLLHPFMPFITEELWQAIEERKAGESIMTQSVKIFADSYDEQLIADVETAKSIISGVRTIRLQKNIAQKETLALEVVGTHSVAAYNAIIEKMGNLEAINVVEAKSDGTSSFMVGTTEYAVPLGSLIDVEAEVAKLQAELTYLEGFLSSVMKKLSNERFVSNAPEAVVAAERKKQADAESKIAAIKETLEKLK
jgi:valyl-tRNA synthetase